MIDAEDDPRGKKDSMKSAFEKANEKTKDIKPESGKIPPFTGRPDRDKPISDEDIVDLKIDLARANTFNEVCKRLGIDDEK